MEYIDLELPSGNLWATTDFDSSKFFSFKEIRDFKNDTCSIPSCKDWDELLNCKYDYFENQGYRIYSSNKKKSIFIPVKSYDKIYWTSNIKKDWAKTIGFASSHDCIFSSISNRKNALRLIIKK